VLGDPALDRRFEPGFYEARFHVAEYYRTATAAAPTVPFLDVVFYRFGIADPRAHYHLPMKCTPWGYSCFRGGA
jgi:5-hydroxyisourate hydrolase